MTAVSYTDSSAEAAAVRTVRLGACDAWVRGPYAQDEAFLSWLTDVPTRWAKEGRLLTEGRHQVSVCRGPSAQGQSEEYAVKVFGRQPAWKDWADRRRGSKARRSFHAAAHLLRHDVGTPEPVACLECWEGGRLLTSCYVSRYEPDLIGLREELIRLYRADPDCARLMSLLQVVADAVARLHRAGVAHRDLGNQNILLRKSSDTGPVDEVLFIDLNRARLGSVTTTAQRAFDLSRITLPSDLLRVFLAMYGGDAPLPASLLRLQKRYRARFARHTKSRVWRHPIRTWRRRRTPADPDTTYPPERDIWIWDERSAQAIAVVQRKDRKRLYHKRNSLYVAAATAAAMPRVWNRYRARLDEAFASSQPVAGRIGMTVHPRPETWEAERAALEALGRMPVLIRFYHHESEREWVYAERCVRELAEAGHAVTMACVQDRRAVREPRSWAAFVHRVVDPLADVVDWVEVGHAINRVKWGIWDLAEYAQLCAPFAPYTNGARGCRLMGPAVIDFEYHYVAAALRRVRDVVKFDALSHHLYVDRRGAPENAQGRFGVVEKCALALALADAAPACASRLIVSEVNWPLAGTGVYSPVGSPYVVPGPRTNDPSVTERAYGAYMVRYFLLTLASGLVERVYWWRLVAHGFGLIDDRGSDGWRRRPAYGMLQTFMRCIGESTFVRRTDPSGEVHEYFFEQPDGTSCALVYAHPDSVMYRPTFTYAAVTDAEGTACAVTESYALSGEPLYFHDVT